MKHSSRIQRIHQKLNDAKSKDLQPFGIELHNWKFNSPIDLNELEYLEKKFNVIMPSEYREFILSINDGGVGPAYGLFSLKKGIECYRDPPKLDILSREFPHIEYYLDDEDPYWIELENKSDKGEITEEEFGKFYEYVDAGTIVICHEGCGYMHRLVITGPTRGRVWLDSSCSDYGFTPFNVSFLTWYENWIDDVLNGGNGIWWTDI